MPVGALAALGYGWLLHRFTDAYAPFIDSAVLALSVAGQILLMRRKVETWVFWFIANTLAVVLFFPRTLDHRVFLHALLVQRSDRIPPLAS